MSLPNCYRCERQPCECHDGITLYHADCRDILLLLEKGSVDLVLTDPPYGILNLNGKNGAIRKSPRASDSGKLKNRKINTASFQWDNERPTREELENLRAISGHQIIWGGNYLELPPTRCILAWDKIQPWPNFSQVELAWTSLDRPAALFRYDCCRVHEKQHPTQKPLPLILWCLNFIPNAKTVLDPFAGSGTTGRACKDLGRKCIMVEIEERYCEIAARRLEQEVLF